MHFDRKQNQAEENVNHRLNKVEQKFENIQIAIDFLSVLKLRYHSKWRVKENEHGEGMMLVRTFVLKVINNEKKINAS